MLRLVAILVAVVLISLPLSALLVDASYLNLLILITTCSVRAQFEVM